MQQNELISKLIDLQEKEDAHVCEYRKLEMVPGKKTKASLHYKKAMRLRSRIQELIHQIATLNL
jgi:hypothetical protein